MPDVQQNSFKAPRRPPPHTLFLSPSTAWFCGMYIPSIVLCRINFATDLYGTGGPACPLKARAVQRRGSNKVIGGNMTLNPGIGQLRT